MSARQLGVPSPRPTPLDLASRKQRARIQQVGVGGRFAVACQCGWSRTVNGHRQAESLKRAHDREHLQGRIPVVRLRDRSPAPGGDAA